MDNERWEPIPDAPGYHISDQGRIASAISGNWRILTPSANRDGYYAYPLPFSTGRKNARIHRLVARAFLAAPPTPKYEINHRDGKKANNAATNLEWVTRQDNLRHRYDVLGKSNGRGESAPRVKLSEAQVLQILMRRKTGELLRDIAADYGVTSMAVCRICNGTSWKHLQSQSR